MSLLSESKSPVRFGRWVVVCLALWIGADIGGRFLPVHWLNILPEHEATRRPPLHAPFQPGLSILNSDWIGETALKGNLPPTETSPPFRFSTDSLGFRLTPGVSADDSVDLLLTEGASFAYGGGLADEETLPAVVTASTGMRMYNGGRFWWDPQTIRELDLLLARLGNHHPAVVLLYWEQVEQARSQLDGTHWRTDTIGEKLIGKYGYWSIRNNLQNGKREFGAFWNISPLEIFCVRFFKSISNDRLLPNGYRNAVEERKLPGGQRILFLEEEVKRATSPPGEETIMRHGDYFGYYKSLLKQRGCDMYVVLLPNKYTLYAPLLGQPDDGNRQPYLNRLETELRFRDISVINGLSVLQPYAAADLASGQLSFHREDHHWTPLGVRRIAAALAKELHSKQQLARVSGHAVQ
jgi:SGNH hydrolase-like domain, acetyltransferase AlgX